MQVGGYQTGRYIQQSRDAQLLGDIIRNARSLFDAPYNYKLRFAIVRTSTNSNDFDYELAFVVSCGPKKTKLWLPGFVGPGPFLLNERFLHWPLDACVNVYSTQHLTGTSSRLCLLSDLHHVYHVYID